MCLTVLVPLLMLIIFLGNFWSNQASLVAFVRNEAWRARSNEANEKAFDFQKNASPITKNHSLTVQAVPFLRNYARPRSSHMIFGDAWHARANDPAPGPSKRFRDFNDHWNRELSIEFAKFAGENNLGSLTGMLGQLSNMGDIIQSSVTSIMSSGGGIDGIVDQFKQQAEDALDKGRQQLQKARKETQDKIDKAEQIVNDNQQKITQEKNRLDEIAQRQKEINDKLKDDTLPDEEKDKLEKETDSLKEEKTKVEERIKGLEKSNRDLEDLSNRLEKALNI